MTAPMLPTRPTDSAEIGEAALRLRHVVGFPPSTAAGYDVVGCLDLTPWLMEAL